MIAVTAIGQRRSIAIRAGDSEGREVAVFARVSGARTSSRARSGRPSQKPRISEISHQATATMAVVALGSPPTEIALIAPRMVASAAVTKTVKRSRSV